MITGGSVPSGPVPAGFAGLGHPCRAARDRRAQPEQAIGRSVVSVWSL